MKTVYLIRHCLPDFPGGKRMCLGRTDISLGEEGLAQARELAVKLPPVAAVFSSPLARAVQTARAIGTVVTVEDLQELYAGEWDGLTFDEIRETYPDLYAARGKDRTLPLPGAESNEAGLARFTAALTRIAESCRADMAVVSHGGVMALFLQQLTGTWEKPGYGQIIPLSYENGKFTLQEEL